MRGSVLTSWENRKRPRKAVRGVPCAPKRAPIAFVDYLDEVPEGFSRLDDFLDNLISPEVEQRLPAVRKEFAKNAGTSRTNVRGLAKLRLESGMSQQQLASQVGTSQSRLSRWESHLEAPSIKNLIKIKTALGVDYNSLMSVFENNVS